MCQAQRDSLIFQLYFRSENLIILLTYYSDYDEYPEKKPPRDLEFDDIPIGEGDDESFSEYGEEPSNFNEDGSFIGVYSKDTKKPPRQPNPTESNV